LSFLGVESRRLGAEVIDIWPDNWLAWDVWVALEDRWRVISGMNGDRLQGLDAAQMESTLHLMGVKPKKRRRVFAELLEMEEAALAAIYGNGDT
jgi:hypothetical protein